MKKGSALVFCAMVVVFCSCEAATNVRGFSCGNCRPPKFHSREIYLPFCAEDASGNQVTHPNLCGAICVEGGKFTKGSCDGCEKSCSAIFTPVCSQDQQQLYVNECYAKCAGDESFVDCDGLGTVIPGKTKLPPNKETPKQLQDVQEDEASQV